MLTKEQIEQRKNYIGGSDAAKICGASKWGTPYTVWCEKTGRSAESFSEERNDRLRLGTFLEPFVIEKFKSITDDIVFIPQRTFSHEKYPFICANVDALITPKKIIVEAKTARLTDEWGENGSAVIPDEYRCQVAHYMAVKNYDAAKVAVFFIDKLEFRFYDIERDLELEDMIIEQEVKFWENFILKDQEPPITFADNVKEIYKKSIPVSIEATDEIVAAHNKLKRAKGIIKKLEEIKDVNEKKIMAYMQGNDTLTYQGAKISTWKTFARKGFDAKALQQAFPQIHEQFVKASEYRMFLVK